MRLLFTPFVHLISESKRHCCGGPSYPELHKRRLHGTTRNHPIPPGSTVILCSSLPLWIPHTNAMGPFKTLARSFLIQSSSLVSTLCIAFRRVPRTGEDGLIGVRLGDLNTNVKAQIDQACVPLDRRWGGSHITIRVDVCLRVIASAFPRPYSSSQSSSLDTHHLVRSRRLLLSKRTAHRFRGPVWPLKSKNCPKMPS